MRQSLQSLSKKVFYSEKSSVCVQEAAAKCSLPTIFFGLFTQSAPPSPILTGNPHFQAAAVLLCWAELGQLPPWSVVGIHFGAKLF